MKVKATGEFKRLNLYPIELGYVPEEGKEFEVSEERFKTLNGMNQYGVKFIELAENFKKFGEYIVEATKEVETAKKEVKTEKAVKTTKKTTKKSKQ